MGLFDNLFSRKEKVETFPEFVLGVEDIFKLKNSTDLVVVGRVKGTVKPGAAVYIHTWDDEPGLVTLTTVKRIEIKGRPAGEATNTPVALMLENVSNAGIKIGTVLATRNASEADIHSAYINAIGNSYVSSKALSLSDEELDNMSVTDMAEAWRLYLFANRQMQGNARDDEQVQRQKMDRVGKKMIEKILALKQINIVFSTETGEPFLFSQTVDNGDGTYKCMYPEVMMITTPYVSAYKEAYSKNGFEIITINNGEDGKGIYNFLGSAFYLDGGCALRVNGKEVGIVAEMIVPPPSYDGVPKINIPVTNPDLMRWILLLGQLGEAKTDDEKLIEGLYYGYFQRELPKARFLIPMKYDGDIPVPDENGKTILQKNTTFKLATIAGKEGRDARVMYTDWRMLRKRYGEDWSALVQSAGDEIKACDCAINLTDHSAAGIYVNKSAYEEAEKVANKASDRANFQHNC